MRKIEYLISRTGQFWFNVAICMGLCTGQLRVLHGNYPDAVLINPLLRILHGSLCFIEFIKRVVEKR